MTLKRKAILFAGIDYRPEAFKDLKTGKSWEKSYNDLMKEDAHKMMLFLKTDIGGKWSDQEIFYYPNNLDENLKNKIKELLAKQYDYLFFYYVGHGAEDDSGYEAMQFYLDEIAPSKEFYVEELKESINEGKTNTYLVIMNFCRTSDSPPCIIMPFNKISISLFDKFRNEGSEYLNEIKKANGEKIIVYTTEKDKPSLFSDRGGVFFTESLFQSIYKWAKNEKQNGILDISQAIENTNQEMKDYKQKAVFEIEYDKISIPIAVK